MFYSNLIVNNPVLFTGKTILGSRNRNQCVKFTYYEFVHKTDIVYIMAIEDLKKI